MILLDSSALIEFYRPDGNVKVRAEVFEVIAADRAATNGIIQVEVVAFARGKKVVEALRSDFLAFHWFDLGREQFDLAGAMGNEVRSRGITIPSTDLIIAASAIAADATLYHLDHHFDEIAALDRLKHRNLSKHRALPS